MNLLSNHWKGRKDFLLAQGQIAVVLVVAYVGNNWPHSYPRNENAKPYMFWAMNALLLIAGIATLKHDGNSSSRGVQLLSRPQTEEWKGWMQWAFIMYHYYRYYGAYNAIRVFVSAYVWMTGFGNFQYFDKKSDFSLERAISMWLRINYFPILLSLFLTVPLELYYVVPLHTAAFFITMATCALAQAVESRKKWSRTHSNIFAIAVCFLVHVLFYETKASHFLKLFSDEYYFRFTSDRYSAWVGILSGFSWGHFKSYIQWCYGGEQVRAGAMWMQRAGGVGLIALWWILFGHIQDKFTYNPIHPYVFWIPVAGWLMLRNSSRYLCELHSEALEFFGRITLETYVLQFHVFMCRNVQFIPIVIPGAGADGSLVVQTLNMLLCGVVFVTLAYYARHATVLTQTTVTELMDLVRHGPPAGHSDGEEDIEVMAPLKDIKNSEHTNRDDDTENVEPIKIMAV